MTKTTWPICPACDNGNLTFLADDVYKCSKCGYMHNDRSNDLFEKLRAGIKQIFEPPIRVVPLMHLSEENFLFNQIKSYGKAEFERGLQDHAAALQGALAENEQLKKENSRLSGTREELLEKLNDRFDGYHSMANKVTEFEEKIQELKRTISERNQQMRDLRADALRIEYGAYKEGKKKSAAEIATLKENLAIMTERAEARLQEIKNLEEDMAELQLKVSDFEDGPTERLRGVLNNIHLNNAPPDVLEGWNRCKTAIEIMWGICDDSEKEAPKDYFKTAPCNHPNKKRAFYSDTANKVNSIMTADHCLECGQLHIVNFQQKNAVDAAIPKTERVNEQFIEDHLGKMPENDHSEDVREKVTHPVLDSELSLLFRALDQTRNMGLHQIYREEWQEIFENKRGIFLKKLEYLVGLQKENEELMKANGELAQKLVDGVKVNIQPTLEIQPKWFDGSKCLPKFNRRVIVKFNHHDKGIVEIDGVEIIACSNGYGWAIMDGYGSGYISEPILQWRYDDE